MSSAGDTVPSGTICLLWIPPLPAWESPLRHLEHLLPLLRPGPGCVRRARSHLFSPQRSAVFALSEIRFHRGTTGCADGLSWGCGGGCCRAGGNRREPVGTSRGSASLPSQRLPQCRCPRLGRDILRLASVRKGRMKTQVRVGFYRVWGFFLMRFGSGATSPLGIIVATTVAARAVSGIIRSCSVRCIPHSPSGKLSLLRIPSK